MLGNSNRLGSRDTSPFQVSVRCESPWLVVEIRGELDLATVPILEDSLHAFSGRQEMILFDLAGIEFIDVVGAKPIVMRCQQDLARIGPTSGAVRRILQLLGADARVDRWLARSAPAAVGF